MPYRMISTRGKLLTNEIDSVTVVTVMRGLRGDVLKLWAAWRGAGHGLVFTVLLIGACSAPEAPAPERPALRFSIPDYIFVKDTESVYVVCNKATAGFFNANEAEIIGRTDFDFVDHETAESFRARDRGVLEAGRALCNEEWLNYADGPPIAGGDGENPVLRP